MVKTLFYLDAIPVLEFEGYHDGSNWNGWAIPYFEYAEAVRVLSASERNGYSWDYDIAYDEFVVEDEVGSVAYGARLIDYGSKSVKVYGIGAAEWTWSVLEQD